MRRLGSALLFLQLISAAGDVGAEVTIESEARKIRLTGQMQTQFNTSSVDRELFSEFIVRRARIIAVVELNDFVSGKVEPDFSRGAFSLKDAYMTLTPAPWVGLRMGQFKRPFDLFELTAATELLVIERDGVIRGLAGQVSHSSLTRGLGFSNRDVGVELSLRPAEFFSVTAAVTNGLGADLVPSAEPDGVSEMQIQGRVQVLPIHGTDLAISLAGSTLPYRVDSTTVRYADAAQLDVELGNFTAGPHVQAGVVIGDNRDGDPECAPTFMAFQLIGSYKARILHSRYLEAVEPLVRVSWADPDTDGPNDGGVLITPGIQAFFTGRNKIALNVDIFVPRSCGCDTEFSVKAQSTLFF